MPKENIFEESNIHANVRLSRGKSDSNKATCKLVRRSDKKVLEEKEIDLEGKSKSSKGQVTFKLPKVEDKDDEYEAELQITCDGKSYEYPTTWRVWPQELFLEVLDDDDPGMALPDAELVVKQGTERVEYTCNPAGKVIIRPPAPGAIAIEPKPPFDFVKWDEVHGRYPKATYKKMPYTAEFVGPNSPGADKPIRQFINKDSQEGGRDGFGSVVEVVVAPKEGRELASEGEEVHVEATFTNETLRKSGERKVEGLTEGPTGVFKGAIKMVAGGTATMTVHLGKGGGERCEIKIGTTKDCADDTIIFESWRKIYYQLTRADHIEWSDRKRHDDCWEEVFVHVEQKGDDVLMKKGEACPVKPRNVVFDGQYGVPHELNDCSWVEGADLKKDAGDRLIAGDLNQNKLHEDFLLMTDEPELGIHIVLVDYQYDFKRVPSNWRPKQLNKQDRPKKTEDELAESEAKKKWGKVSFKGEKVYGFTVNGKSFGGKLFPRSTNCESLAPKQGQTDQFYKETKLSVYAVRWQSFGTHPKEGWIPEDHIDINYKDNTSKDGIATIKFPQEAVDAFKTDKDKVGVKLIMDVAKGPYLGATVAKGKMILIVNQSQKDICDTVTHEIGHAIGMCCDMSILRPGQKGGRRDKIPDIDDPQADHGRHYTGHMDQGNHCADGVNAALYKMPTPYTNGSCVIFGHEDSKCTGKWCARCQKVILAMDISIGAAL